MKGILSQGIITVGILVFSVWLCVYIFVYSDKWNKEAITNKVVEMHGTVVEIKEKTFFESSPFYLYSEDARIYKFTYIVDGIEKIGWVCFDGFTKWDIK
jgi:hypothetical protein